LDLAGNATSPVDEREVFCVREVQGPEAIRKIRMVQEIEEFTSELELSVLGKPELFEEREVQVFVSRAVHLSILASQW
jgi:hypothetical protein